MSGPGKIVSMSDYIQPNSTAMPDRVEAAWHRLRQEQLVPYRSELDPGQIEEALAHAFIAERVAPGHARLRIAGSHLSDLMGMEVRGMPMSALFDPASRELLKARLEEVFTSPGILRLTLQAPAGFRRGALAGRAVLLPMRNDMGDVTRLLGCLECTGLTGRRPRRLTIEAATLDPIASGRTSDQPGGALGSSASRGPGQIRQSGLSEAPAPFHPAERPRPDWLRLVTRDGAPV